MKSLAIGGAAVAAAGATILTINYLPRVTLPIIGAVCVLIGFMSCATAYLVRWNRTFDAWFDAGYRVGFRAGKRDQRGHDVVQLHSRRKAHRGALPATSVWLMAGDRAAAGREPPHSN